MSVVLPSCVCDAVARVCWYATGSGISAEMLSHRVEIENPGDAQGTPESAPAFRQCEARWIGMQVSTPARHSVTWIGNEADLVNTAHDGHDSQQLGG
jgi:hypothetical protein